MSEPLETVAELSAQLAAGATSALSLVERSFARLDALDPALHAFLFTRENWSDCGRRSFSRCSNWIFLNS